MKRYVVLAALLLGSSAVVVAAPPKRDDTEKSADARDKVICKRFLETGSLVKGTRICKTKAEWDRDRQEARGSVTQSNSCAPGVGANC